MASWTSQPIFPTNGLVRRTNTERSHASSLGVNLVDVSHTLRDFVLILATETTLVCTVWLTRFGSNLIAVFIPKLSSLRSCSLHLRPGVGYLIVSVTLPPTFPFANFNIPIKPVMTHPIVGVI